MLRILACYCKLGAQPYVVIEAHRARSDRSLSVTILYWIRRIPTEELIQSMHVAIFLAVFAFAFSRLALEFDERVTVASFRSYEGLVTGSTHKPVP